MFKIRSKEAYNPLKGHKELEPSQKLTGRRSDEHETDKKHASGKKPFESDKATASKVVSRGGRNFGKMMRFQKNHKQAQPMQRGGSNAADGMKEY